MWEKIIFNYLLLITSLLKTFINQLKLKNQLTSSSFFFLFFAFFLISSNQFDMKFTERMEVFHVHFIKWRIFVVRTCLDSRHGVLGKSFNIWWLKDKSAISFFNYFIIHEQTLWAIRSWKRFFFRISQFCKELS